MGKSHLSTQLSLHFIVILLGFTGILGKLITIPAIPLVWIRVIIASAALLVWILIKRGSFHVEKKDILKLILVGAIVSIHWISFFQSIKVSNISVALGCLASATLFTGILEPIYQKRKASKLEISIGVLIIIGLYLIFQFETRYVEGILYGILAAFLNAAFLVLNKSFSKKYSATVVSFYEMLTGAVLLTLFAFFSPTISISSLNLGIDNIIYLLILGIVCTAVAFAAPVYLMKELSAFDIILAINMEPIYGILMAFFIFGDSEKMSFGFYMGTLVVIAAVFIYPIITIKRKREQTKIHSK